MKYTREIVEKLDKTTLDFASRWIWDSLRRMEITAQWEKYPTQKAQEKAQAKIAGMRFALETLQNLQKYNLDPETIASEFDLLDYNN